MATYVILSRLASDAFKDPMDLKQLAATVAGKIKAECPAVTWKDSYPTLGRFDVVDVAESNDLKQRERAALIIRGGGHAATETMQATPWDVFIASL
ncbi:GYD family protein [Paraburkholderia hospita]|uniref:GYD family protein n=1 Tax=Paraburkholderia hospita TaxID=169430 RepID=A0AAN1MQL9_9BURK|nr:GYD domain-containing protein [Paraburkholderia hospita]AUT75923.1 GYD family protein [Paraburkholderia hospita]